MLVRLFLALMVFFTMFGSTAGWADESRVALVIGNGAYRKVPALPNPPRDAGDVADALEQLGFNVTRLIDGDLAQINQALLDFAAAAAKANTAIVFYAGHGIEAGGQNWLIPVDAEIASDTDASKRAISLHQVQGLVEKTNGLGLIILDACRDNPFAMQVASEAPAATSGGDLRRHVPDDIALDQPRAGADQSDRQRLDRLLRQGRHDGGRRYRPQQPVHDRPAPSPRRFRPGSKLPVPHRARRGDEGDQ
jgi:hypothetical protein